MTTRWKIALIASLILSAAAFGFAVAAWVAADVEIAQIGVPDPDAPIYIDLNQVMLHYNDPLGGLGYQHLTVRQVIQDALWYQVNNPQVSEAVRMECFSLLGLFHEGRSTEISQGQYDILLDAMQNVWGPGILMEFEARVGGGQ